MVLIIKEKGTETFHIARLAPMGFGPDKRLISLIDDSDDLDERFVRVRLYRTIIDKLLRQNKWHRARSYDSSDVSNTLHDWIVDWFEKTKERTLYVEVDNNVFS